MLYVDASTYPILRWGVERAATLGTPVQYFPHHDAEELIRLLRRDIHRRRRPVVVTDGWSLRRGDAAPVRAYLHALQPYGGHVIIDDTQALGILGKTPTAEQPYGQGGGGILRWTGIQSKRVAIITSLAKGFGVPVAALSGSGSLVRGFEQGSHTRSHCSPPSMAILFAAARALSLNRAEGELRRWRLLHVVRSFRAALAKAGLSVCGSLFPVQTFMPKDGHLAEDIHRQLLQAGVLPVLLRATRAHRAELGFLLNARQHVQEVVYAANVLARTADLHLALS